MTLPYFPNTAATSAQLNVVVDATNANTTALQQSGELGYAQITTGSASFTTVVDIASLTVSFTLTTARTVQIRASLLMRSTVAADTLQGFITDASSVALMDTGSIYIPVASASVRSEMSVRLALAAASYTYKIRASRATGTGTATVNAAAVSPSYIQALDVT